MTKRTRMPLLPALLLIALVAGCGQPEVRYLREDFPFERLLSERVATLGFVLGARAGDDPTAEAAADASLPAEVRQSWAWVPHLETALLVQAPEMDRWSFASVADQIEPERLAGPLRVVARGGVLTATELEPVAADLPGVGFLLVGRLVGNELSLESRDPLVVSDKRWPAKQDGYADDLDTRPLVKANYLLRREVIVGLELYDLAAASSIWSAQVSVGEKHMLDTGNFPDQARIRVENDPEAPAGVRIEGDAGLQGGPELEGLLDEACGKLVGELLAWARPADEAPGGD